MTAGAGYSGTPLPQKLGIKEGHWVTVLNAPKSFVTGMQMPRSVTVSEDWPKQPNNVILFFTRERTELEQAVSKLKARLDPAGGLWIAWPKKAARVPTDITEDVVRAVALDCGLVDNKVCAIDATWSGLRLVFRLKDRPTPKALKEKG